MTTEPTPPRRSYLTRFRPYRGRVIAVILLSIVQSALLLPVPLLIGVSIDEAIPDGDTAQLVLIAAGMALFAALSVVAQVFARAIDLGVTMRISRQLRRDVYGKLIELPRSSYDKSSVTDLHDRVVNDTLRIQTMTSVMVTTMLPTAVLSIGLSIVLFSLDWRLTLVTFAFAPVMFLAGKLLTNRIRHAADVFHPAYRDFSARALLMLRSQDLIRLAGAEAQELEQADSQLEHLRQTNQRVAFLSSMNPAVQQGVIAVAGAALLLVGGLIVIDTEMTLGELLSFYAAFAMLRGPAGNLAQSFSQVVEGQQALDRVHILLADPIHRPYQGGEPIELRGNLRLDHVDFEYDTGQPVVRNVTLDLAPGKIVTLMGPNGSGKSTLVNLLLGFYRPTAGVVTADGRPYDEIDMSSLRPQLGVVTQDPFLFPDTVRANIVYGKSHTAEELALALELSGADRVIEKLPAGLDTHIGDDGVRLSGGQRQRVAIARALLGQPRVLIFDEPTNHLDNTTIETLLRNLRDLSSQLSILIVSHHDVVLRGADTTIELADGHIAAVRGDHASNGTGPDRPGPESSTGSGPLNQRSHYRELVHSLHGDGVLTAREYATLLARADRLDGDPAALDPSRP